MSYLQNEQGDLYDEFGNLLAYHGDYTVNSEWEPIIYTHQGVNPSITENISNTFSWRAPKEIQTNIEWKYPSELNFKEDIERFVNNIKNIWSNLFVKKSNDNVPRWKLFSVSHNMTVEFLDKLATLIGSWIRLIDSIRIIRNQTKINWMKLLLWSIENKLNNWKHLSSCFEDYNYIFPLKWIKLIMAAEKSWQLDKVISDLAEEEKQTIQFVWKIKWAMIYPVILLLMALGVFILMMVKVVPSLEKAFWSIDKLPKLTQNIIFLSHYMQDSFIEMISIPLVIIGLMIILNSCFITVQKIWDYFLLHLPIFWLILRRKNIILFTNNLSLLLSSWVLVSEALEIVAQILPSILYRREVHIIRHWVCNWQVISKMMWLSDLQNTHIIENPYFPLEIAQMIKIWEETWNTIHILNKIKEVNSSKLNDTIKNLTSMLEPIITIIIWAIVWILLMAFMVPMMSSFKTT